MYEPGGSDGGGGEKGGDGGLATIASGHDVAEHGHRHISEVSHPLCRKLPPEALLTPPLSTHIQHTRTHAQVSPIEPARMHADHDR